MMMNDNDIQYQIRQLVKLAEKTYNIYDDSNGHFVGVCFVPVCG